MSKDGGAYKSAKNSEEKCLGLVAEKLEKAFGRVASCAFKAHEAKTVGSFDRREERLIEALLDARRYADEFAGLIETLSYGRVGEEPEVFVTAAPSQPTA